MNDTFTEADLEPSPEERRAKFRSIADRIAASLAVVSAGVYIGGLVALGACAAPFVFRMTPAPFSGNAMGAAFGRFDQIAIGASAAVLLAEVVRTFLGAKASRTPLQRVRRFCALFMAFFATYVGLSLTPRINELHRAGVTRGDSPQGQLLDAIHARAELFGKIGIAFALALIVLSIFTIRTFDPYEDDEEALAPLPPGPRDA